MKIHVWDEMPWEAVAPLVARRFITGVNEMVAQVSLKKGAVVPEHTHESEQISSVLTGALRFRIGGSDTVLRAGQALVIPPQAPHEVTALEDTLTYDIFSPIRYDWLNGTDDYFRKPREQD